MEFFLEICTKTHGCNKDDKYWLQLDICYPITTLYSFAPNEAETIRSVGGLDLTFMNYVNRSVSSRKIWQILPPGLRQHSLSWANCCTTIETKEEDTPRVCVCCVCVCAPSVERRQWMEQKKADRSWMIQCGCEVRNIVVMCCIVFLIKVCKYWVVIMNVWVCYYGVERRKHKFVELW